MKEVHEKQDSRKAIQGFIEWLEAVSRGLRVIGKIVVQFFLILFLENDIVFTCTWHNS